MPINITRHIAEDRLELYLLGRLSRRPAKVVEEHLLFCPKCLHAAEQLHFYLQGLCAALRHMTENRKVMVAGGSPGV